MKIPTRVISYYYGNSFFWLRIFEHGVCVKDTNKHKLRFSERNGYCKKIIIGKWCVTYLKPNGIIYDPN